MGIKRVLSRLVRRLKPKKRVVVVDTKTIDATQVISAEQIETSVAVPDLDASPVTTGCDPSSLQVVPWQPSTFRVPSLTPVPESITSRAFLIPSLLRATTAFALGVPPSLLSQALVGQQFLVSLFRAIRLEHNLMLQWLQRPVGNLATSQPIANSEQEARGTQFPVHESTNMKESFLPQVPEIRYLATDPTLAHLAPMQKIPPGAYGLHQLPAPAANSQGSQTNDNGGPPGGLEDRYIATDPAHSYLAPEQKIPPAAYGARQPVVKPQATPNNGGFSEVAEIRYLAADPAFARFAPRQKVPPGAYGPCYPPAAPIDVSLLPCGGRTVGTSEINIIQAVPPDPSVPPKRVPRYPPGLGYPNEQVDYISPYKAACKPIPSKGPAPVVIPTQPNAVKQRHAEQIASEKLGSAATRDGSVDEDEGSDYEPDDSDAADARFNEYAISLPAVNLQAGMYKYRLTRTIGQGGNGTVWFGEGARDDGPPMDVAIKVINRARWFSSFVYTKELKQISTEKGKKILKRRALEASDIVRKEYSAWLQVTFQNHPFFTPMIDCFSDNRNFYFVMRYYPENLRQRVSNKACRPQLWQIRLIAAELVLALEKLHSMRIVHHDLKLENVLVTPNGHVALCDFGNVCTFSPNLAEKEWNDNTMKGRGGTDGYLSPEQYVGDGSHNYKVDIYGFGLMLLDLFMPLGTPWYHYVPGVDLDARDLFADGQPDPRQRTVMSKVYDVLARDLLIRLLDPNPARRPGWSAIKAHPFFTNFLDWRRVLARDYDPYYRACSRRQEIKPIIRPSCWIRQCHNTRTVDAVHELLKVTAHNGQSISSLELQAPRGLGWVDKHHGVSCGGGMACLCDFPDIHNRRLGL